MTKCKAPEDLLEPGRPKEGLDSLPEDWIQQILEKYSDGAADVQIRCMISNWRGSYSNDLWYRWINEEPLFSEIIKRGKELSEAWWVQRLRDLALTNTGNPAATIFAMTNRFPDHYKHKAEINGVIVHDHKHRAISELDSRTEELAGARPAITDETPRPN